MLKQSTANGIRLVLAVFLTSFAGQSLAGTYVYDGTASACTDTCLGFDALAVGSLLDGGIDIDRIRAFIASKLHLVPRYRQRLAYVPFERHPVWVDDEHFQIDYHVRHSVLPAPGDDRQLENMVARLHANLLDRDRPLWEFHLIEGLRERRFAFYTKIHHCIADGVTFTRWFVESGSTSPDARDSRPVWQRGDAPPEEESPEEGFIGRLASGVTLIGDGVKTALDLSSLGARLIQHNVLRRDRNAVLPLSAGKTALNTPTGAARSFAICQFPLEDMKAIAHASGASVASRQAA